MLKIAEHGRSLTCEVRVRVRYAAVEPRIDVHEGDVDDEDADGAEELA